MKTNKLLFAFLFGILFLLRPSYATSNSNNEPQPPAKLNVTFPAGWHLLVPMDRARVGSCIKA